jgi:hypothetical protein
MPEVVTSAPAAPGERWSFVWWCPRCCRSEPFTADDLAGYARAGWPVCCGQKVMCHYADLRADATKK